MQPPLCDSGLKSWFLQEVNFLSLKVIENGVLQYFLDSWRSPSETVHKKERTYLSPNQLLNKNLTTDSSKMDVLEECLQMAHGDCPPVTIIHGPPG